MIKNKLREYILNSCLEVSLEQFFEQYNNEFNYAENKKRYPNNVQRLAEYLKGLPNHINIPFYYYDIEELVKSLKNDVTETTLKRYRNYFFEIVSDILINEYNK